MYLQSLHFFPGGHTCPRNYLHVSPKKKKKKNTARLTTFKSSIGPIGKWQWSLHFFHYCKFFSIFFLAQSFVLGSK